MSKRIIKQTQAERVIELFGGVVKLRDALKAVGHDISISAIYKWTHDHEHHGRGGLIPSQQWPEIIKAAQKHGLKLTQEHFNPTVF